MKKCPFVLAGATFGLIPLFWCHHLEKKNFFKVTILTIKKPFLQTSQENNCVGSLFLRPATSLKRDSNTGVFLTIQLICSKNQLSEVYMAKTFLVNGLNQFSPVLHFI